MKVLLLGCLAMCVCACGDKGSSPDGGDGGGDVDPECGPAEMVLVGTLDSEPFELRSPVGDWALTTEPPVWILYPDEGGRIRFELPDAPVTGEPIEAMVTMSLGSIGGPDLGNCRSDGHPSLLTLGQIEATFVLRDLLASPFCGGEPVDGQLAGCARLP